MKKYVVYRKEVCKVIDEKEGIYVLMPAYDSSIKYKISVNSPLLKDLITKKEIDKLEINIKDLEKKIKNKDINIEKIIVEKENIDFQIEKLDFLIKYYENNLKVTYGCTNLITTISKFRLISPINEYDIVGKARCSDEVLNIIDNDIIQKLTNSQDKF